MDNYLTKPVKKQELLKAVIDGVAELGNGWGDRDGDTTKMTGT